MPTPLTPEATLKGIREDLAAGMTYSQIVQRRNTSIGTIAKAKKSLGLQVERSETPAVVSDKKIGSFNWEEWNEWIESGQKLRKKASFSQDFAKIQLGDGKSPVIVANIADLQIGCWGVDYEKLRILTQEILETPNFYVILGGDLVQMAIKMRSVLEVTAQVMPPEQQIRFLESWLEKIWSKVVCSCWCNHGVEREEKAAGLSSVKNLLASKSVYFNGIGHPDIIVGSQTYKCTLSHRYRGSSIFDSTFGPKRYMRMEANDREIAFQSDLHRPAISEYFESGMHRLAMTCGTIQTNSGFAKRYFSLFTQEVFPSVVLHPDEHKFVPFWNLQSAVKYVKG
jgi:hypothetical protein